MKKNRKLVTGILIISISLFSSMTVAYANQDIKLSLTQWFHGKIDSMVNNSITNMESKLNEEKDKLMTQLEEQINLEKQRAKEELEQYKEEQLQIYNEKLSEIVHNPIENTNEEKEIVNEKINESDQSTDALLEDRESLNEKK